MRSKKALLNIITAFSLQLISFVFGLIVPRLIIGTFGSSVNGVISSITQFLSFIVLLEAGAGGVVRAALYKPLAKKDIISVSMIVKATDSFFKLIALIFIGYLLVVAVFFPYLVRSEFDHLYTFSLVIIIGISTFVQYYYGISYQILLAADQKQYFNNILQTITVLVNSIITILLIKFGVSIHIVKLGSAIIFIVRPILLNIYVRSKYKLISNCKADNVAIKQRWDGLGHHIAYLIRVNFSVVILTLFTSTKEVSVYSVYYMVVHSIQNLVATFSSGLEAAFGNMIAKDEGELLDKNFRLFEFFSFSLTTVLYTSTAVLILPFISLYTKGVSDVNYIRPAFAYTMVIAQAVYCIRIPYNSIVLAAGHYRQTRNGAFAEAIISVLLSIVFVKIFGLIGIAISSFCSLAFRTTQYAIYISKNILKKSILEFIKRVLTSGISATCIVLIIHILPFGVIDTYVRWILYAIVVTAIAAIVTIATNSVLYFDDIKNFYFLIRRLFKRKTMA